MNLRPYEDPAAFQSAVTPFLMREEALNTVALGVTDALVRDPSRYPVAHLWALEEDAGVVAGAAWLTPPHPLGLTEMSAEGVALVAEVAGRLHVPPDQVYGPREVAGRFCDVWCASRGVAVGRRVGLKTFHAEGVTTPFPVSGAMRRAAEADRALLTEWSLAFSDDCKMGTPRDDIERAVDSALRDGTRFLWVDAAAGGRVAMAAALASTARSCRIGWVYTPPAMRGRGYATGLVAKLTEHVMACGRRCVLHTDESNPTSNSIYQRIGYRQIGESVHYWFA